MAIAGMPISAQPLNRSPTLAAPSSIEYSEWTCRWTKESLARPAAPTTMTSLTSCEREPAHICPRSRGSRPTGSDEPSAQPTPARPPAGAGGSQQTPRLVRESDSFADRLTRNLRSRSPGPASAARRIVKVPDRGFRDAAVQHRVRAGDRLRHGGSEPERIVGGGTGGPPLASLRRAGGEAGCGLLPDDVPDHDPHSEKRVVLVDVFPRTAGS